MRHRNRLNKLSLKPSHRNAMIRNMLTSFFRYESIQTTTAKAKVVQKFAEKMITRSKVDSVHNRREIAKSIYDKDIVNKLFTVIGPRFDQRSGGCTRILKLGNRQGDAAEMALLELVEKSSEGKDADGKKVVDKKKTAKKVESKISEKSKVVEQEKNEEDPGSKTNETDQKKEESIESPEATKEENESE